MRHVANRLFAWCCWVLVAAMHPAYPMTGSGVKRVAGRVRSGVAPAKYTEQNRHTAARFP